MQKHQSLEFNCQQCKAAVCFSIFELESMGTVCCPECQKKYGFKDPTLIRQIKKFFNLCRQLQESEEILGNAAVGIDIAEHQVKIPYKILLTRLTPTLDLKIGDQPFSISFRFEPSKDLPLGLAEQPKDSTL